MTYDPITDERNQIPPTAPGTVVVSVDKLGARMAKESENGLLEKVRSFVDPKAAVGILIALIGLTIVMGPVLVVILMVVALGSVGFVLNYRDHPLSIAVAGAAPKHFTVDISMHTIRDERVLQLKDAGVYATIIIEYNVMVRDAVKVVVEGVRDVQKYLSQKIHSRVKSRAPSGMLEDKVVAFRKELDAISTEICQESFDHLFKIEAATIDATVKGPAGEQLTLIAYAELARQAKDAEANVAATERSYLQLLVTDYDALTAEMMREGANKETLQTILRAHVERENLAYTRKIELLRLAIENGVIEERQINVNYPDLAKDISDAFRDVTLSGNRRVQRLSNASNETAGSNDSDQAKSEALGSDPG